MKIEPGHRYKRRDGKIASVTQTWDNRLAGVHSQSGQSIVTFYDTKGVPTSKALRDQRWADLVEEYVGHEYVVTWGPVELREPEES